MESFGIYRRLTISGDFGQGSVVIEKKVEDSRVLVKFGSEGLDFGEESLEISGLLVGDSPILGAPAAHLDAPRGGGVQAICGELWRFAKF